MTPQDHIEAALNLLGDRTGCEPAKVHALLAIAQALLGTRPPTDPAAPFNEVGNALVRRLREARGEPDCDTPHPDGHGLRHCAKCGELVYAEDENTPQDAPQATLSHTEPLLADAIRRDLQRTPEGRGGTVTYQPATPGAGRSGCPGDNLL